MKNDDFISANPFRALDKKQFVKSGKKQSELALTKKPVPEDEAQDDTAMFHAALVNVREFATMKHADIHDDTKSKNTHSINFAPNPKSAENSAQLPEPQKAPNRPIAEPTSKHDELFTNNKDLFSDAMADVRPLSGKGRMVSPIRERPEKRTLPSENLLQDFMDGKIEFALQHTAEYIEGHVHGLDLITVGKLQAGQFSPEAHIDLHGLNADQAFQALLDFIRNAYYKGYRTVLVVTGRGLNSPNGIPVLRTQVQSWLMQEPLRRVLLAFCTAQPAAGGAGALYLLLRKFRKNKGKIYWDRRPVDI
jgi:DNA-nicking Smr family endonuclease